MRKVIPLILGFLLFVSLASASVTNDLTPEIIIDFTEEIYPVTITKVSLSGTGLPYDTFFTGNEIVKDEITNLFSVQLPELTDGNYVLKVLAKDDLGNEMTKYAEFLFTIDSDAETIYIEPNSGNSVNLRNYYIILYFLELPLEFSAKLSENGGPPQEISSLFSYDEDYGYYFYNVDALDDGVMVLNVSAKDNAGNDIYGNSKWWVNINPPVPKLISPAFSIITDFPEDFVIETPEPAKCRYSLGSESEFKYMAPFEIMDIDSEGYGLIHNLTVEESVVDGDYLYYFVVCQDKLGTNTGNELFLLKFDTTEPEIIVANATPEIIYDEDNRFTEFYLEVDEPTKCKYDPDYSSFGEMRDFLEIVPMPFLEDAIGVKGYSFYHRKKVNILSTEDKEYDYYVACQNVLGNISITETISFAYDPDLPVDVKLVSPSKYVNETSFTIEVKTNRDALCKIANNSKMDKSNRMGSLSNGLTHRKRVYGADLGLNKYYIECIAQGLENVDTLTVSATVDDTPPSKPEIKVLGLVATKTTWRDDELEAEWEAEDDESGISKYEYSIWKGSTKIYGPKVTKKDEINVDDLDLDNGKSYFFKVKAMNNAGLWGDDNNSITVKVDTSKRPPYCEDGEKGTNESDVDCGQNCGDCDNDKRCFVNSDCKSDFCLGFYCKESSCTDGEVGGDESDTDCGGSCSNKCVKGKNCTSTLDCASGLSCSSDKKCEINYVTICNNKKYDPGSETDTDCGKLCVGQGNKCDAGDKCTQDLDCKSGNCENNVCFTQGMGDTDGDGEPDSSDNCYNDKNPDQLDTDGDGQGDICDLDDDGDKIPDADENFHLLNPKDASDADDDPDGDGLTNYEEIMKSHTDPYKEDTDGDGISDYDEYHSNGETGSSIWKILLWIFLILIILGLIGFLVLYFMGDKKTKKKEIVQKPSPMPSPGPSVAYRPVVTKQPRPIINNNIIIKPKPTVKSKSRDDSIKAMKNRIMKEFEVPKEEEIEARLDSEEKKEIKKDEIVIDKKEDYFKSSNLDMSPKLDKTLDELMKVAESNEKSFDSLKKEIKETKSEVKKVKKKVTRKPVKAPVKKKVAKKPVKKSPAKKPVKRTTSVKRKTTKPTTSKVKETTTITKKVSPTKKKIVTKTIEKTQTSPDVGYTEVTIKIPNNANIKTTEKKVVKKVVKKTVKKVKKS
jgi:hypothetical protein